MKVFINKRKGSYSGGLIIVAANSELEAHGVMCAYENGKWLNECYEVTDWVELPNVTYNKEEPCFIAESGYTE